MKNISMSFGVKEEFLNDSNQIAVAKALAERKAKEAIGEFITNEWTGETITIKEGEWVQGIPYDESPNVIPFSKTYFIRKEDE